MAQASNLPQAEKNGSPLDLEALSKYVAVSGAFAYAIGTLTVNIYLHELGITDFSLAKPKLILTGLVVLLTFLLLSLFPVFIVWRISVGAVKQDPSAPPTATIVLLLHLPLVGLIAASVYLCLQKPPGSGEEIVWRLRESMQANHGYVSIASVTALLISALIYVPICLAAVSASMAARLLDRAKSASPASRAVQERVYFPAALALAVISFFLYIYIFSITFYPAISPAFGGGKPYYEILVVAEAQRCQWQKLGIPFIDQYSNATAPLQVLHESNAVIAIWLVLDRESQKPIVVQLDKSQISAARMAPSRDANFLPLPTRPCVVK
jgi:hypothetical protein